MPQSLKHHVTQATFDRYGRINGDNDIIHYDDAYAKKRGFRGTLAHGLMVMGYAAELAAKEFGDEWYTGGRIHVKWVGPVCPEDDVSVNLDAQGNLRATVTLNGREEVVLVGEAGTRRRAVAAE